MAAPLVAAGVALAGSLALRMRDPHVSGSWGFCPLRAMTGLDCPFCGGLRATNDLTHGDLGAAIGSNLMWVVSIPLVLALWAAWLWRLTHAGTGPVLPPRASRIALRGYVALALVFTIWRNTPWGHDLWA